ncbi:MAG: GIY-YIG nuclease family protein [Gammaproteobacteria bacterium]|nr:GIY-YIG nuclease family protein [Gammaproteobacteria bacterium]MBU1645564.1 GIY-YIG nuclease family protein [Gammaproteobacteria bacterium]MBU1973634.1 GIY-YIG nuclease family protein [Gammaproteobacteria bacterium]
MTSATIKLFLPHGDAKRLRVGEVSNWTGKALAAPRTELDDLLLREEVENSGVYFLFGADPESGDPVAYIGEAEVIRDRLKQHKAKDFWNSVVVFVSKDENLTKAHIRYLENRLLHEAKIVARYHLENSNSSNPKLPESDREDMEVFLARIQQVLPVLGADLLAPVSGAAKSARPQKMLMCKNRGAEAQGRRTERGFVVFKGSTAVIAERPSAETQHPYVVALRRKLVQAGALVENAGFLAFTKDVEFDSPSAAAAVIHGGGANGLTAWKDNSGRTLKEVEEN